ncbi:MAG: long-chain fatty acid--CoA ligase [Myxococcales bacterium]|nr:long-chain fatty acid--CoA ligase [Myxococcales bacterium]MCB9735432.1 long-chain fatty acid--CoA ligase [Deltaproteobacteria bacterium]
MSTHAPTLGRMMHRPLLITHLLERAATIHGRATVVSQRPDKTRVRRTYADIGARASRLAHALAALGVTAGTRVATLCWNHEAHLEAYVAVPCMGAVVHTLNLRLHPNDLAYIARHANDEVILVDRSLLPLFAQFAAQVPSLRHVIVVGDSGPVDTSGGHRDYETLLAQAPPVPYPWPDLDENAAAMICYTSGTTGNPKGVVYSHRSTVLHSLVSAMADTLGLKDDDVVLPVVPMFHAAAWGLPYTALLTGASLVFPGPHLDAASVRDLMVKEKVTVAAGVPTIWLGLLALLDEEPGKHDLSRVRTTIIGGSAAPAAMIAGFRERHGIIITHAWGMTELNPLGTVAHLKPHLRAADAAAQLEVLASQGAPVPFVEIRHKGEDDGPPLPWDGATMGELETRGPWVADSYVGDEGEDRWTADGWFKTGDVVTIDREGYVRITDRAKDVVKSGGEWISSVALENALMSHPAVLEAAVFAARDEKWGERPVAAVVFKDGRRASDDELRAHLATRFPKFWLPDRFVAMHQIPRTSTGKFLKSKLREEHGGW